MSITTHLFVGQPEETEKVVLQKIGKHRFDPSIVWISPEKPYLLSDLDIIFEKTRFSLSPEEKCFFILQKAHTLSPICANKLLKILEEPPPGYIFFLTTTNEESIISTIRSRCHIHHVHAQERDEFLNPLLLFFIDKEKQNDPFLFEQELKKQKPSEQETIELIQTLTHTTRKKIITQGTCRSSQRQLIQNRLAFFENALKKPPQPGGAMLFWKKLFLTLPR
jgi:hypothetical protein